MGTYHVPSQTPWRDQAQEAVWQRTCPEILKGNVYRKLSTDRFEALQLKTRTLLDLLPMNMKVPPGKVSVVQMFRDIVGEKS